MFVRSLWLPAGKASEGGSATTYLSASRSLPPGRRCALLLLHQQLLLAVLQFFAGTQQAYRPAYCLPPCGTDRPAGGRRRRKPMLMDDDANGDANNE